MRIYPLPTPKQLHERLRYEPNTGKLYWRTTGRVAGWWSRRYLIIKFDGVPLRGQRVIWAMVTGKWPDGEIDHEDQNPGNNRIRNLRVVSISGNQRNATRRIDNTSGVTGVRWEKNARKWRVQIKLSGPNVHIGMFNTFEEAVLARKIAEVKNGYHPNHGTLKRL